MSEDLKNNIERRGFLKKLWTILGIVAGIEIVYLVYNFFLPNKKITASVPSSYFEAGAQEKFKNNSITSFRSRNFFLTRLENGEFIALSTRCTHLGCALTYDKTKNLLVCPCHSSIFDIKGKVLRSPATRNLDHHEVIIEKNIVKVNTGVILTPLRKHRSA